MPEPGMRRVGAASQGRLAAIAAQIAELGPPLPGSVVARSTRCGNPGCRCRADPPRLHGPYLTWTRKVGNKTVTRTLTPDQAATIGSMVDNSRRLGELITELEALALARVDADPELPNP